MGSVWKNVDKNPFSNLSLCFSLTSRPIFHLCTPRTTFTYLPSFSACAVVLQVYRRSSLHIEIFVSFPLVLRSGMSIVMFRRLTSLLLRYRILRNSYYKRGQNQLLLLWEKELYERANQLTVQRIVSPIVSWRRTRNHPPQLDELYISNPYHVSVRISKLHLDQKWRKHLYHFHSIQWYPYLDLTKVNRITILYRVRLLVSLLF